MLRTADATSPLAAATVLTTLVLFVVVYGIVFAMGIYYINRLIERGPQGRAVEPPEARLAAAAAVVGARRRTRGAGIAAPDNCGRAMIGVGPAADLGRRDRHRGRALRHPRRLRSRRRHPVPVQPRRKRARPDDRLDRAVLGRQRDLAGARRRRAVGRLPARLCGDHVGALSAGDRDAARRSSSAASPSSSATWPRPASATGISPSPPAPRSPRSARA